MILPYGYKEDGGEIENSIFATQKRLSDRRYAVKQ